MQLGCQNGPKLDPKSAKMAPKSAEMAPKSTQDRHKSSHVLPRPPQSSPKAQNIRKSLKNHRNFNLNQENQRKYKSTNQENIRTSQNHREFPDNKICNFTIQLRLSSRQLIFPTAYLPDVDVDVDIDVDVDVDVDV
jgi:hypothetical protein